MSTRATALEAAASLPISKCTAALLLMSITLDKSEITACLRSADYFVLVGETGSGKSTQLPQIINSGSLGRSGKIAITQPKRIAAITLARRVSQETGTGLGGLVGYSVRFDERVSEETKIVYLTDGMLLREYLRDPALSSYSYVCIDEAHERSLRTDVLLGLLKSLQEQRRGTDSPLTVIVMSATLDVEKFELFFSSLSSQVSRVCIEGRQHPVTVLHSLEPQKDYLEALVITAFQIHFECPEGDILAFLPGQEDIETAQRLITENSRDLQYSLSPAPIYASLPPNLQLAVFEPPPPGRRKIVLATNIAESSITIPGIKYVIDPGLAKSRIFHPSLGMESLVVSPISKASCRQSANLSNIVLFLKASGISDVLSFDYLDRPPKKSLVAALEELHVLKAIGDDGCITAHGRAMAAFPLEPKLAKVLLVSGELGCSDEVLSIISLLSIENLFYSSSRRLEESGAGAEDGQGSSAIASEFSDPMGDHLSYLRFYKAYMSTGQQNRKEWLRNRSYVNRKSLARALKIREQLESACRSSKVPVVSCGTEQDLVLKSFLQGYSLNVAVIQPDKTYKCISSGQIVRVHPTSSLFGPGRGAEVLLFHELVFTSKCYMRAVSKISPLWISSNSNTPR